jgi:FkbM family methyltransferase
LDGRGVDQRLAALRALGCRRTATFLELGWRYPGILPHFGAHRPSSLLAHAQHIAQTGTLWEDAQSQEIFRQQLSWRLRGDFSECSAPAPAQYFPMDLVSPLPHERIVDGGAYDGDTLRCVPWGFERAWAFEPDPMNAERLRSRADSRVTLYETALGQGPGTCRFEALGSTASSRQESGTLEVAVASLDDVLSAEAPTFVKLDVEGDELDALRGAARLLDRAQPVVAVCIYHNPSHLWSVPLFLSKALPRHTLHLRSHEYDGFELVAYAVPPGRRP